MNKKSVYCNILILIGLSALGTGLFFWFGLGQSLAIPGGIILSLGVWGSIR